MRTETPLARFVDEHTMVYDRTYPHPIERVWEAVSTGEHLDVWMLPESRVERRFGGRCAFGWGSPADHPDASVGEVTAFEPPTAIEYSLGADSFMRFDLVADGDDATTLHFTLHFVPGDGADHGWHPDFLTGYHVMVDRLDAYLRGEWAEADARADLERQIAQGFDDHGQELIDEYAVLLASRFPST